MVDPATLIARLKGRKRPPVQQWNPDYCGDIDMRIGRDGTWYYLGSPIGRKRMVELFAGVLRREGDDYFLVTPAEKIGIRVDDAPFLAVEMVVESVGRAQNLSFRTNVDDAVTAGAAHPIRVAIDAETDEPSPYVMVRDGLEARIARPVFYDLVELGSEENGVFGVWSGGVFFPLGAIDG